ncbi:MAG TPA: glycerol-3-phosphate dehydrogenase/oxidase [Gaiellaceae bacterium]|nr:glycerol-3-phosphate dehydrogenase/oxidase [Gaiellaceae bacterium]
MQTFAHDSGRLEGRFDLVVVGAGIVGSATAALAARAGLRVALLERHDLGSGTSSASSKLIHGGLRYLRMGDVRLVREALAEARVLRRTVAPHLVRELEFVLPVYEGGPYGPVAIRAALAGYGVLGGRRGRVVTPGRAAALVPHLRVDGLRAAGVYADAQTNDARLVLANARAAADAGAVVATRCEVTAVARGDGGLVVEAGGAELHARAVVNAAGPWVDAVRRLEDPQAGTSVALSKGVHLVLAAPPGLDVALTIPVDRTRVSFALPWEGMLLLGTTDSEVDSPGAAGVGAAEEEQVLEEAARGLDGDVVRPELVRARFAGLRVLPLGPGGTARTRREVTCSRGPLGMVSVAGGKLTTYRLIARSVLDALRTELGGRVRVEPFPLPGAGAPPPLPDVPPEVAAHLVRTYGSLAGEVAAYGAFEPLVPGEPEVEAQVLYARDREWAVDAEDVLRRRTTLALRGLSSAELEARVRTLLSGVAGAAEADVRG